MRILSGVQSSGQLHLGNYYGAIAQFVALQHEGEALYFIANLHALNTVRDGALARELSLQTAAAFIALGVDPVKAALFRQSDIPEIAELYWILGTVVPVSNLDRAHSYKDKLAKGIAADFGLYAYPVLMAADILLYDSDEVPVGRDQVQHLEFTRDWAVKFNLQYVPGYDPALDGKDGHHTGVLRLPRARVQDAVAVVPGVDGEKMSKSYHNTIDLFGDEKAIEKRIKAIKTDSTVPAAPKPLDGPLYALMKVMLPPAEFAVADAAWRAGGTGYGDFKKQLLATYLERFGPARATYAQLMSDRGELERLLALGAQKARAYAAPVIARVRTAVGL